MIISRTPLRISFFGGGTDFPQWYEKNGGAVLSTAIDKYCYISCRKLPPFFEYKHKINYFRQEQVSEIDEIMHPGVRETLRYMKIEDGLEIHYNEDLPVRSGLGSSSSFTVGLLHALYALNGKMVSKKRLALEAIHIEQDMVKENVGSQDQVAVALGGLSKIMFSGKDNIEANPIILNKERYHSLQDHLLLFFTGLPRTASKIEKDKIENLPKKNGEFAKIQEMVDEAIEVLNGEGDLCDFGKLLDKSWKIKKALSEKVSTNYIDYVYDTALKNGAVGGKVLGAGGGGFILFFVKPKDRSKLLKALGFLLHVPFRFDSLGSQIIYYTES
jgi:D-glycero-alpha-D-manno-heptose-7-phosphate kinase